MEYRDIHFRLESGYAWGKGMEEEKLNAFHKEIADLFVAEGWKIEKPKYSSSCETAYKGKSRLYLHPMEASGEVEVNLIPEVERILSKGTTFKHYHTDNYRELHDMSDKEYAEYLQNNKENIKRDLLNGFKTNRSNLYITAWSSIITRVKEKYHIDRLTNHITRSSSDLEWMFTEQIFKELIESGEIAKAETKKGIGYRTNTKV